MRGSSVLFAALALCAVFLFIYVEYFYMNVLPSEAMRASPEAMRASPEAMRASPGAMRASPEAMRGSPGAMRASPEVKETSPGAMRASPEAMRASPEAMRGSPEVKETSPGARDNVSLNLVPLTPQKHSFTEATLRAGGVSVKIYVHNKEDMISSSLLAYGVWEAALVNQFADFIRANPGIQVLDAGCNLGVYTLVAAALGAHVVSVDANPNNTNRLVQSVVYNGFIKNVKICLNALTNVRKAFVMTDNKRNIGSQNILEDNHSAERISSVFVDDLVPLFNKDQSVIIKIDIETREIEAFHKAKYFFSIFDVKVVMIEWEYIKRNTDIGYLLEFFKERKFVPFNSFLPSSQLELTKYLSWPSDVIWMKK